MKPSPSLIAQIMLLAACWLALLGSGRGQEEIILHSFGDGSVANDGSEPVGLIQGANGNFYETTIEGGSGVNSTYYNGQGTVFEVTPSGTVAILHNFGDGSVTDDGATPNAGLVQGLDGNFYGTTNQGGSVVLDGTVFKITPQGAMTILHNFGDGSVTNDGLGPRDALIQGSDGNFYGTTYYGGAGTSEAGTVFKITPQGTVTILHSFGDGSVTNDGEFPAAGLVQGRDGNFYGTTTGGGSGSAPDGTVFKMTPQGAVTILHTFGDGSVTQDGRQPTAGLIQGYDGNFYGTTGLGGTAGNGVVFKISSQGVFTILHNFGDGTVANDGATPYANLIQGLDGNFYGTTLKGGGSANQGTAFKITPQGTVSILHDFGDGSVANDGFNPPGLVLGADGNFYGSAGLGGSAGNGAIFKLVPGLPNITSALSVSGNVGLPFHYQVTGTNTPTSYAATGLPGGLSIDSTSGIISGTPALTSSGTVTLTLTNAAGSNSFPMTLTIAPLPVPVITSILTAYGSVGTPFTYQTTAINTTTSFFASGLTFGFIYPTTGIISGTPTSPGTVSVTLTAENNAGTSAPVTLVITILSSPPMLSQEYNVAHLFGTVSTDGVYPQSILQAFDGNFYGVTSDTAVTHSGGGGIVKNFAPALVGLMGANGGTVFKMTPQGVESTFYSFVVATGVYDPTSLIQSADGNFYGTTGLGQIFKLTSSAQLLLLHSFGTTYGQLNPLIQGFDGNFYGTSQAGGSANAGTIFKVSPQGTVTFLHNFGDGSVAHDGSGPKALVQGSDGNLYGTTQAGGSASEGTVFKITPQGTETILHNFGDGSVTNDGNNFFAGSVPGDGNYFGAALLQGFNGNFYGTTPGGGSAAEGTVFEITPQGTETILHHFGDGSVTNDGAVPFAGLIQGYDGNFYGTTLAGVNSSLYGTVFAITEQGAVTIAHSFSNSGGDGTQPTTPLIQSSSGNFYGVTTEGGAYPSVGSAPGNGTIYLIQAMQVPTHLPIYIGSAYESSGIYAPFSFTPKAAFGVSGSGVESGNSVQAEAGGNGMQDALVSMLPQTIRKFFSTTNWALTGTLPNYLTFDPTSGAISGTPVQAGTFTVTMTPTNALGSGMPMTVTFYIDVPPVITSSASATCPVNTPFSYPITALPPADSYGATFLPDWLSIDTTTGIISGTPPAAGSYLFDAVAVNVSGQMSLPISLTVTGGASSLPTLANPVTANATVGASFNFAIPAANSPMSYTALPLPLPASLIFNSTNGVITGYPTEAGNFTFPITATNASGSYASLLSLTITAPSKPDIASTLTATALEGVPFTYFIPATGVVGSYTETGNLPAGLSLKALTGVISGTPTAPGPSSVMLTISNVPGTNVSSELTINVVVPLDFSQWEMGYGITSGPTATPENDGVPNLLKYLFDINPTVPLSATDRAALPTLGTTTISGTQYLTLTYRQYTLENGLTVNVQTSPDLQTWTTVINPTIIQTDSDPNTGDPIMQAQVPVTGSKQFMRLDVILP